MRRNSITPSRAFTTFGERVWTSLPSIVNLTVSAIASYSICGVAFTDVKSNLLLRRLRLGHELPNRLEDDLKLGIVLLLQPFKLASEIRMCPQQLAQVDKRTHD